MCFWNQLLFAHGFVRGLVVKLFAVCVRDISRLFTCNLLALYSYLGFYYNLCSNKLIAPVKLFIVRVHI